MSTKIIIVTGGVVSSLGKGIITASLGALLKSYGFTNIKIMKVDPYLNIDPGTMSPHQHGEVFVLKDGSETDLDLGYYERFTETELTTDNNYTSGQIFSQVFEKERNGDYLGETVQVIPHLTNHIKSLILKDKEKYDFILVEIGGTIGDLESMWFLESVRQLRQEYPDDTALVHLSLIPYLEKAKELKTKPTQHTVKELMSLGLTPPDVLVCRTQVKGSLTEALKRKIAQFCNLRYEAVIESPDLDSIYQMPSQLHSENIAKVLFKKLNVKPLLEQPELSDWLQLEESIRKTSESPRRVKIIIVGKYVPYDDAYKSLVEAIRIAGYHLETQTEIIWVNSRNTTFVELSSILVGEGDALNTGLIVPGGFGEDGTEFKLMAIKIARELRIPFLGICFGMQLAAIEFAQNVMGLPKMTSEEFHPTTDPSNHLIKILDPNVKKMGGTMRLGNKKILISDQSIAHETYGCMDQTEIVQERHRHRFDLDIDLVKKHKFHEKGFRVTGSDENGIPEIIEIEDHPYFIAVQYHPEYTSTLMNGHPLFKRLIQKAIKYNC